ncbi:hypothetical protein ACW9ID_08655 [Pseudomonas gingeri]
MPISFRSNTFASLGITYEKNTDAISALTKKKEMEITKKNIGEKLDHVHNCIKKLEIKRQLLHDNPEFKEQANNEVARLKEKGTHRCLKNFFRSRPITSAYPTYDETTKTFRLEDKKGIVIKTLELYRDKFNGKNHLTNNSPWSRNYYGAGQLISAHNDNTAIRISSTQDKIDLNTFDKEMKIGNTNAYIANHEKNRDAYENDLKQIDKKIQSLEIPANKAKEKMDAVSAELSNEDFANYLEGKAPRPKHLPEAIRNTHLKDLLEFRKLLERF